MSAYCDSAHGHPVHGPYHDTEYGSLCYDDPQPVRDSGRQDSSRARGARQARAAGTFLYRPAPG